MTENVFSAKNYSIEANYQALEDLVQANPSLWSDKYLLGTGQQLLRVIAAGQSANGVRTLQALFETFIGNMQRKDSILGYGETMGYSAFRGSNDVLTIVAENTTGAPLAIPARTVVGSVQGVDLVCLNPIVVNKDASFSFRAKVGNLKTESRSIADTEYKYIRYLSQNVSDDVQFYINNNLVSYYTAFKDVANTEENVSYVLITNAYGSVDLFIVQKGLVTDSNGNVDEIIDPNDIYTINFIEYTDLKYTANDITLTIGDIQLTSTGELNVTQESAGEAPQGVESLRACIPYFRDTQREVLANRDPLKVLRLLMPNVENTSGSNLNAVHSLLSYKYKDYHLVPDVELLNGEWVGYQDSQLATFEKELTPVYYFGFCPSNIYHPIQFNTLLDVEIVLFSSLTEKTDVQTMLSNILSQYEKLPTITSITDPLTNQPWVVPMNLDTVESEINKLVQNNTEIVKTAYVNVHSDPVETGTTLYLGRYYNDGTNTYRVVNFAFNSGNSIPSTITDTFTPCGQILLEKWRAIYGASQLKANTYYEAGAIVSLEDTPLPSVCYRVHPLLLLGEEPEWNTELGDFTYDAGAVTNTVGLIWLTIELVPGTPTYSPLYRAIKSMIITPEGSSVSYQLIGFTKTVDNLDDSSIIKTQYNGEREISNLWNSYTIWSMAENSPNIHT